MGGRAESSCHLLESGEEASPHPPRDGAFGEGTAQNRCAAPTRVSLGRPAHFSFPTQVQILICFLSIISVFFKFTNT